VADRTLTLMAVHAHPDDEATSTGGVLAKYSAEGVQTVLVTCTDGGCGDGPGGVKPGEPGHDPAQVVAMRRGELEASCAVLKVSHLELLGYADSGMMGWATNDAPTSFWKTPVDEAATRLATLIDRYQPDVIVTYDAYGFYGHPDHIQTHRVTMAAIERTGTSAKVYWTTASRSRMEELRRVVREYGGDWDEPDPPDSDGESPDGENPEGDTQPPIGLPDDEITAWVDTRAYGAQKFKALEAHASQSENIFFLRMGQEKFTEMMGIEAFVRVDRGTPSAAPEDDLFAGLR
jgi:LmbE family N-acetylglucosaminyl deacetylase